MSLSRLARAAVRSLQPSIATTLLGDWLGNTRDPGPSRAHLDGAIRWLCAAQDQTGGRGVSAGYSVVDGWLPPYPETTGYIIPTMLHYAALSGHASCRERAQAMADWELEVQLPSGAVLGGLLDVSATKPAVFNTGQVILGLCAAEREFGGSRYGTAAARAGDWLVEVQSRDGSWSLEGVTTETQVHSYDVRTAWSLLELFELTGTAKYREAALRNCQWTLAQQRPNGWFENNAFFARSGGWDRPFTHTIAYVMEGLLESWRLTGDQALLVAAERPATKLLDLYERRRRMAGQYDAAWQGNYGFRCLTGDAQIAGVWLQLYEASRDIRYLNAALRLNDDVKATQRLSALHPGVRGGVKGSQPIWGQYTRLMYINWGAKFLADSLMREEAAMQRLADRDAVRT